ncbi:hypothetical protein [Alkalispirochaeta americana]|uniref:hypothetical protein n=1 Tax=Alkalispirochaeta americana TaxID=159291 RepID=UPI00117B4DD8|nr:hypothetical protein [Alkalispirochaeta americana]
MFGETSGYRSLRLILGPESRDYSLNSKVSTGVGDFHLGSSSASWDSAWAILNRPEVAVEVLPFIGVGHSRLSFEAGSLSTTMEGYVVEAGGYLNILYRGLSPLDIGFGLGFISRQNRFSEGLAGGSTLDVDIDATVIRIFCIAGFRL